MPLTELAGGRWIMREAGSRIRLVAEKHFADHGFNPCMAMSLGSNEALKHAVGAGPGLAVISALTVQTSALSVTPGDTGAPWVQLPVKGFPLQRVWSIVWRSDAPLAAPALRFVAHLRGLQA